MYFNTIYVLSIWQKILIEVSIYKFPKHANKIHQIGKGLNVQKIQTKTKRQP
jgi:hypothetical protein